MPLRVCEFPGLRYVGFGQAHAIWTLAALFN